jgi:hypothetical protein
LLTIYQAASATVRARTKADRHRADELAQEATTSYVRRRLDADDPPVRQLQDCNLRGRPYATALPHRGRSFRAVVEIDTLRVRAGNARHVAEAIAWARENLDLLRREWHRLNRRA